MFARSFSYMTLPPPKWTNELRLDPSVRVLEVLALFFVYFLL
jgi:hypothetical protein